MTDPGTEDFKTQRKLAKKAFRVERAAVARARLIQEGWSYCNDPLAGRWICLSAIGRVFHFWPSTGRWNQISDMTSGRGLEAMICAGQEPL
jgi:hypothetical protein